VRTRSELLAVAVAVLLVAGATGVLTHHGSFFGLGRQAGLPAAPALVNAPPPPTEPAIGSGAVRAATRQTVRRSTRTPVGAYTGTAAPQSASAGRYPGPATCPDSRVPSSTAYAFQCTHGDGSPVRWPTGRITMWVEGLTPAQTSALEGAEAQWTPETGISLVPVSSSAGAQLVVTEVPTLDALADLGPSVVEYAVTEVHQTGGYYDHAAVQVANAPLLDADTWVDTMLHELGHVAGLSHVSAPDEIMRPVVGEPQTSYGAGDLAGLQSERPR